VLLLLEKGIDIDAKSVSGDTALHMAALNRHQTVVQLLKAKGANFEKQRPEYCYAYSYFGMY
jgi:ankyrin repeat protein